MGSAEEILESHGSDDLFYYTQVALHWFKDGVPSIDGLHPTTGFQPLFALLLMPASGGFTGDTLFSLRVTLGLASLLTLVLAWSCPGLMVRWLGQAWGKPAGTLLGCLFLLHPRWLELEFSGTEAALAALAWVWSLRFWSREFSSRKGLLGLGFILGLGTLARVDHVFLAFILVLVPYGRSQFGWFQRSWLVLVGWLCIFAPWILFCVAITGSPLQDSGQAKRLQYQHIHHQTIQQEKVAQNRQGDQWVVLSYWMERLKSLPQPLVRYKGRLQVASLVGWALLTGLLGVLWVQKRRNFTLFKPFAVLTFAAGTLLMAYGVLYGYLRAWYYVPAHVLLSAVCASAWVWCWQHAKNPLRWVLAIGMLVWVGSWIVAIQQPRGFAWEPIYLRGARELQAEVPGGARIGAFNAGIQTVVAGENYVVINLDGVVNHQALRALQNRELVKFLAESKVQYLIDHRSALDFYQSLGGPELGRSVELLKAINLPQHPGQELCLWRLNLNDPANSISDSF